MARRSWSGYAYALAAAAASAALIQYKTRKAEAAHPPKGRFIEVDGVRLHYLDRGLGVPLVMLHGIGTTAEDFERSGLIERASSRYRIIAFDRPGFGYSERPRRRVWTPDAQAELLHRALEQLAVKNFVLLGHSWGALVALAYALRHPADVRGVVVVSGYFYPTLRLDAPLFAAPALPVVGDVMRYTLSPWFARALWPRLLRRMYAPAPVPPAGRQPPTWMTIRPSQLRAVGGDAALTLPATVGLARRYSGITVPVHIVAGREDRYVSTPSHSARLHRHISGSTFHEAPDGGHMLPYTLPETVMDAIDRAAGPRPDPSAAMEDARAAVATLPSGGDIAKRL